VGVARTPNRRGEGARLRAEIVAAARRLLERGGNEDALTLRAVAREAGIAAPSIYGHFADREQILDAVVAEVFGELEDAVRAAADAEPDPARRLASVCRAYLRFAEEQPAGYRVLFGRSRGAGTAEVPRELTELAGAGAFGVLAEAVLAARAPHGAPTAAADGAPAVLVDATALWVALHGYATLRAGVPVFPWPDGLLTLLVDRLAGDHR
jgi:AcrR family transcriptional regulator